MRRQTEVSSIACCAFPVCPTDADNRRQFRLSPHFCPDLDAATASHTIQQTHDPMLPLTDQARAGPGIDLNSRA